MSFLPDWWSQGTTGNDSSGGFGTAAMFNQPDDKQRGDLLFLLANPILRHLRLADSLKSYQSSTPDQSVMPQSNSLPSFTPYQGNSMAPQMGKINSPLDVSPNGQIMPNWNRKYGGY